MKKILCLALALAMVMSLVPVAFAAPAVEKKAIDKETVMANTEVKELAGVATPELEDVPTLYNTTSAAATGTLPENMTVNKEDMHPMGSWQSITPYLIEFMDPEDVSKNVYIFDNRSAEGGLEWADADLEYGESGYGTWVVPTTDNTNDGNIRDKGEHVFLTVSAYNGYENGAGGATGIEFPEDVTVEARVFLGYEGDATLACYDLYLGTNGVNIDFTVPENNMQVWLFVFVYVDRQNTDVAFFMNPCMYNTRWDTVDTSKALTMVPDQRVTVDLDSHNLIELVTPTYYFTNAQVYKFEAEKNGLYEITIAGEGQGFMYVIMDSTMQIVTNIYAGEGVVSNGDYSNFGAPFWTPNGGTFYIVLGGFYLGDKGMIDFTMNTVDEAVFHQNKFEIDISDFGHENYTDPSNYYAYSWSSAYNYGMLQFARGAEYTLTGKNDEVVIWAEEWETINLNNCTVNSIVLANQFGPIVFNVTGTVTVEGNIRDKIWNYGTNDAGHQYGNVAFFNGETMKLDGENGIFFENYTGYLFLKTLDITANTQAGFYPVTMWSYGKFAKEFRFGKNFKFNDSKLHVVPTYFASVDTLGFLGALYCYTISDYDELYYWDNPDLTNVPQHLVVTSDGPEDVINGILGDVNGNGKLDTGDATLLLRTTVGAYTLTPEQEKIADYNGNGKVDTGDATLILRAIVSGN